MTLSGLINQIAKCETAINVSDQAKYDSINNQLWRARRAMNMAATYLKPQNAKEALFLHGLIDELITFVDEEPEHEDDKDAAVEAIQRVNRNLMDFYKHGAGAPAKLRNLFCLAQ